MQFNAVLNQEFELFNLDGIIASVAQIEFDQDGLKITNGQISFTGAFPCQALQNTTLNFTRLWLDAHGNITSLQATMSFLGQADKPLFDGLTLRNGVISINMLNAGDPLEFDVAGTLVFPAAAPGILSGRELVINSLEFNSLGQLLTLDAATNLPANSAFIGGLQFGPNCQIGVKASGAPVVFSVTGSLIFPATAPGCLANQVLTINNLTFDTFGQLTNIDASVSLATNSAFIGGLQFGPNCQIGVKASGTPFAFSVAGSLILPATAPGCLANQVLAINNLTFDTNGQLTNLNATLPIAANSEFIGEFSSAPIVISVSMLLVHRYCSASPAIYSYRKRRRAAYPGAIVPITSLQFDSNGNLQTLQAGLSLPGVRPFIGGLSLKDARSGLISPRETRLVLMSPAALFYRLHFRQGLTGSRSILIHWSLIIPAGLINLV